MNRTNFSHYFSFLISASIKVMALLPARLLGLETKRELFDENITESYRNNATEIGQKCYSLQGMPECLSLINQCAKLT